MRFFFLPLSPGEMPMEFGRGVGAGSQPPFPASPAPGDPAWPSSSTKGSQPAGLALALHPKIKARLPFSPSPKVLSSCSRSPGEPGQQCSEAPEWFCLEAALDPSAGHHWSSEKRIQLSLYPACETQDSGCCLGWQKTPKPFAKLANKAALQRPRAHSHPSWHNL